MLYGDFGADLLYGGLGEAVLEGSLGADTLYGAAGADAFRIVAPEGAADTIADFESGVDRIEIVGANFGALPAGVLAASRFALDRPGDADDWFVFDTATGMLSFDADGSGGGAAVAIATLDVRTLASSDILVLGG